MQDQKNQPEGDMFNLKVRDGVTLVTFNHDTFDRLEIERVRDELRQVISNDAPAGPPRLIIDFSHVAFMSSMILGVVMAIHLRVCRSKGRLILCGMRPPVFEIFRMMRLDQILHIEATAEDALRAMAAAPSKGQ